MLKVVFEEGLQWVRWLMLVGHAWDGAKQWLAAPLSSLTFYEPEHTGMTERATS